MLLRTLGEVRLDGVAADMSGRRKDLTLLAYLARKAPHPVFRSELVVIGMRVENGGLSRCAE
jgi:hypothetical protein